MGVYWFVAGRSSRVANGDGIKVKVEKVRSPKERTVRQPPPEPEFGLAEMASLRGELKPSRQLSPPRLALRGEKKPYPLYA